MYIFSKYDGWCLTFRKIYQTELETASCRATLRTAENEADVLREQINKAAREKQILYSKYQSIQDFNKIAVSTRHTHFRSTLVRGISTHKREELS